MRDSADVKIIPPLIPMAGLALGAGLQWACPVSIGPSRLVQPVGIALIVASVALVLAAARSLVRAKTAFDVRRATTSLVLSGPFRISRNPVYLASILLCWGVGIATNSLFVALSAVPSASLLCLLVIRKEERYLNDKFGDQYAAYCGAVRRWV